MRGAGLIAAPVGTRRAAEAERADVLAYLERKIANAGKIAAKSPDHAEAALVSKRAWEIARDDIRGGLHIGEGALSEPTEIEGAPV